MINLTIDASILAIPSKNNDLYIEYENVQRFLQNINALRLLGKQPMITVSYIDGIKYYLNDNNVYPGNDGCDLKERIENLKKNKFTFNLSTPEILNYFYEELSKILSKNKKTGIYQNIPDTPIDDHSMKIKYNNIQYNDMIYPDEYKNKQNLVDVFRKYLGFIAELNYNYLSNKENYLVISGNKEKVEEEIIMKFNNFNKSNVNIIGIQRAEELIKKDCRDAGKELLDISKKYNNMIFGHQIIVENIAKSINDEYIQRRIINYLSTLNDLVKIIQQKNINDEKDLKYLFNAYGCLCSPENEKYIYCPEKLRHFKNENGNEEYFSLHLKPITETKNRNTYTLGGDEFNSTCRIYFKVKNEKILIGWIGKHPMSCIDCTNTICTDKNHNKQ